MPLLVALLVALLAGLTGGCAWVEDVLVEVGDAQIGDVAVTASPGPPHSPATPDAVEQARAALPTLPGVARRPRGLPPYARDAFGSSWSDVDGNGCNQRDDVLLRDALPGTAVTQQQGRCDHDVVAGTWTDPYTGRSLVLDDLKDQRQAQAVQIDHVVPLSEAWRSGAWAWSAQRRRAYANDLGVLLAVDGPTNGSKGDDDPAAWRPRKAYQCTYAVRWTLVKEAWQLAVDDSERAALTQMLDACPVQ